MSSRVALCGWSAAVVAPLAAPLLAVTFTVNDPGDGHDQVINGVCETGPLNGVCTLRAAVEEANAQVSPDPTVSIPALTITLDLGWMLVSRPMTIEGRGSGLTVIQPAAAKDTRFIYVLAGSLTLRDVMVYDFSLSGHGAGVAAVAPLTIERSLFYLNSSSGNGGAIYAFSNLTISDSVFLENTANIGGAVAAFGPTTIERSRFEGRNSAPLGGALYLGGSEHRIVRSYFAGNLAGEGGAIYLQYDATAMIVNSTFVANEASSNGGAIRLESSPSGDAFAYLYNCTLSGNDADSDLDGTGAGGAFRNDGLAGNAQLFNSILADNAESVFVDLFGFYIRYPQECQGTAFSSGDNIVLYNDGACLIVGAVQADPPLLASPAYNGGPTPTLAIPANSPAVDGGNPAGCYNDLETVISDDQRGAVRPFGAACDLGAFEYGPMIFTDDFEGGDLGRWSNPPG